MKRLNVLVFALITLLCASICYADKVIIPFECYPKEIQNKFAVHNIKLDLSGNDRDEKSFGYLFNEGSKFTIYTYKNMSPIGLEMIKHIIMENCNGKDNCRFYCSKD